MKEETIKFALRNKENIDFIFLMSLRPHALNVRILLERIKVSSSSRYVLIRDIMSSVKWKL